MSYNKQKPSSIQIYIYFYSYTNAYAITILLLNEKKNTDPKINETNNDNSRGKQNIKKNSHTGKFNPKKKR